VLTKYEPNSMIVKYQKTRTTSLRSKRSNWLAQPNKIRIHVNLDNDNLYRKINLLLLIYSLQLKKYNNEKGLDLHGT